MHTHVSEDIRQAYTLLEIISRHKIKRMAYEARQAEPTGQRSRMIFAEREGIRQVNRIFHPPPDLIFLP